MNKAAYVTENTSADSDLAAAHFMHPADPQRFDLRLFLDLSGGRLRKKCEPYSTIILKNRRFSRADRS
ncbi:hypothetical protein PANT111_160265 [Pantoea brenneri]|uniref:Uncharacterized protein n=1 Tax=Pantoea brenneri TaxID=472694 RepID=A0AAX3J4W3_9GAMM|nr:hypothetical protein PANT111_160265 [Pantoea brenneri]